MLLLMKKMLRNATLLIQWSVSLHPSVYLNRVAEIFHEIQNQRVISLIRINSRRFVFFFFYFSTSIEGPSTSLPSHLCLYSGRGGGEGMARTRCVAIIPHLKLNKGWSTQGHTHKVFVAGRSRAHAMHVVLDRPLTTRSPEIRVLSLSERSPMANS